MQALSTVPVMNSYWAKPADTEYLHRLLNDHLYSCTRADEGRRFVALGSLPMQSAPHAVAEMKRCVSELGMHGFAIGSNVNGKNLDDASLTPIYKTAEDLDVCLFVHPWNMHSCDGRLDSYWLPWLLGMPSETALAIASILMGGILERHPKLRFCFAHGGGSFPYIAGRMEHGYHVRPDLCAVACKHPPSHYRGRFYTDSLVHDGGALELLTNYVGEHRVVLGTDYPFPLGELQPGKVVEESKTLTEKQKEEILWTNAFEMLNLDINAYS